MTWRPQILTGMLSLAILGALAMFWGYSEVAAACSAGILSLGMKLLGEKE